MKRFSLCTFCTDFRHDGDACRFPELDRRISISEVYCAINMLKRNKAAWSDLLVNEYFVEANDIIASHLVDLFNAILDSGYFPEKWTEGIIIPVFKKGNPDDANNYRGITLVSCLSKLFTGILNKRIIDWAEENNVISDSQFGFRRGRSTTDAIFLLQSLIQKVLNQKGRLYCAFVDLQKAFDSVYLNGLWFKLYKLGIDGQLLRVIRDMYDKVKSCVRHCNSFSEFFECSIGLRQGEVISPVMFSMFLEDLELFLQDDINSGLSIDDITIILLLFADDMVILGKSPQDLQNSIDLLQSYCEKWGLSINVKKTKVVVFRKRGQLRVEEEWFYNGEKLEAVNDFNYLGVVFNYTGSYTLNQQTLSGKGLKALNILLSKLRAFKLQPKTTCQLFDAFVGSILSYGCETWGFSKSKEIERIHLKFCKRILNVKSSTSNAGVYGELRRYPLYITRYIRIIRYWCNLLRTNNIIFSTVYNDMLRDCELGLDNWVSKVKSMLFEYGFGNIWQNPQNINVNTFCNQFKQRLIDCFTQKWNNDIDTNQVLTTYKHFKTVFTYEKYLNILPERLRVPMSKLRLSSHSLRIETGRYGRARIERNQRQCVLCNSDIEDEYHFVLKCPTYNDIRAKYIKSVYIRKPSMYKFIKLMSSVKKTELVNLSKFVIEAFDLRKSLINNNT